MIRKVRKMLVLLIVLLFSWNSATAQDWEKWSLQESKDDLTDEVSRILTVWSGSPSDPSSQMLSIGRLNIGGEATLFDRAYGIGITIPSSLRAQRNLSAVTVQWRVDEGPVVEERWDADESMVSKVLTYRNVKRLAAGKLLRVRIKTAIGTTSTARFNIAGLDYYLPKL